MITTLNKLHDQIRSMIDEQMGLLDTLGRTPKQGTTKAKKWDELEEKIREAKQEWNKRDREINDLHKMLLDLK